jgi:ribose 5-phosphate isomerase B
VIPAKIAIGSDHAGFRYKEQIKAHLEARGIEVRDFGTFSEDADDYPLRIRPVAEAVARGEFPAGIVLGGSGNGEAIVANKVPGIRCAVCWNERGARYGRRHNDANIISIGAHMISIQQALEIVDIWLATPFDGGRHLRRINKIADLERDRPHAKE